MLIGVLLCGGSARAEQFRKGPYIQNVSQRSVTLMWQSDTPLPATVEVRGGGNSGVQRIDVPPDRIPEVEIGNLAAGMRYRYLIRSGDKEARGEFATAPLARSPFSFVVFGDSRSNAGAHRQVVERLRGEVPDFLLGTGDMVNEGHSERDWQQFFDIERDLLRDNVFYPSLGNHDRQGRGRTADNYRKYFSLPENSPNPERYYAFTYGNARLLVLDSNAYSFALTDQTAWIEEQLQAARLDPDIVHIFVSMHHPPYSVSLHGGQSELREAWTPLFEKYRVAAVFSGHDHVYSRAERNGVRYFVSGGGGAPLYPRKKRPADIDVRANRYFERVNHFVKVHVFGEMIEVTAVRADGTIIETVSWGAPPTLAQRTTAPIAPAVGAGQLAPQTAAAPHQRLPTAPSHEPQGFGLLGIVGAIVMLLSGAVLVVSLRR